MRGEQINRVSARFIIGLSILALATVATGYFQAPQPDEGAAAHIFQLSIVAVLAALLLFLATANWKQPSRIARPLVVPAAALALAFAALYYLEHFYRLGYRR